MGDPFTKLPVRWLGYGLAYGECAKYNFSERTVNFLNTMGICYIVCHAVKKGIDAGGEKAPLEFIDTLIYDGIASAIIPCFVAYHICRLTADLMSECRDCPRQVVKWGPLVIGVGTILIIGPHVDKAVDQLLTATIRTLYK